MLVSKTLDDFLFGGFQPVNNADWVAMFDNTTRGCHNFWFTQSRVRPTMIQRSRCNGRGDRALNRDRVLIWVFFANKIKVRVKFLSLPNGRGYLCKSRKLEATFSVFSLCIVYLVVLVYSRLNFVLMAATHKKPLHTFWRC